jgi:hypothetical protein
MPGAGYRFTKETVAGTRRNERDAPFADLPDRAPHLFKDPIGDVERKPQPRFTELNTWLARR